MDTSPIIQSLFKNISPIKILDMIAILVLPIWIIYKFAPDTLQVFKSTIPTNIPTNELTKILGAITNALVTINFAFLFCILIITSILMLRYTVGFFIGYHGSYSNSNFRNHILRMFATSFFRFAIYITALALYCSILFDNPQPLQLINESKAYWVSIFPTIILIVFFLIGLVIL